MAGLTLDAGALIAADRNDRRVWAFWQRTGDVRMTVPTVVLAQVWRGARHARLSALLANCNIEPLDAVLARAAGELCGRARTSDVVDAAVVASAARRGDDILTGDPSDLRHLASFAPRVGRVLPLNELP